MVAHTVEIKGTCYCIELLPGLHQWHHCEYNMYVSIWRHTYHWTQVHFLYDSLYLEDETSYKVDATLNAHVHTL